MISLARLPSPHPFGWVSSSRNLRARLGRPGPLDDSACWPARAPEFGRRHPEGSSSDGICSTAVLYGRLLIQLSDHQLPRHYARRPSPDMVGG